MKKIFRATLAIAVIACAVTVGLLLEQMAWLGHSAGAARQENEDLKARLANLQAALVETNRINEAAIENGFYQGLYVACTVKVSDPQNCLPELVKLYRNGLWQKVREQDALAGWQWPPPEESY